MGTYSILRNFLAQLSRLHCFIAKSLGSKGQALVEFSFIFVILLVVAWIPADFGLAFYTGQQALNAAREGARIASADPNLVTTQMGGATSISCSSSTTPCSSSANVLAVTAARLSNILMSNASVTLTYPDATKTVVTGSCTNQMLTVQVQGTYNYFFYQLLRLLRASAPNSVNITRTVTMRWEHQSPCNPY